MDKRMLSNTNTVRVANGRSAPTVPTEYKAPTEAKAPTEVKVPTVRKPPPRCQSPATMSRSGGRSVSPTASESEQAGWLESTRGGRRGRTTQNSHRNRKVKASMLLTSDEL